MISKNGKGPTPPAVCHPDRKAAGHGMCKPCYLKAYRQKHREKLLAAAANNSLKRKYGIGLADYERMLREQRGGCAICSEPPREERLAVDHCHSTGAVRGLLCNRCNWFMGKVDASDDTYVALLQYLERSRQIAGKVTS